MSVFLVSEMENGTMDKEHIKGAADKAKGAVKDTVGTATGDAKCRRKGKWIRRREQRTTLLAI